MEIQLAAAQQLTHVGSWEWDLATNAVIWSDELYRTYRLKPGQVEITYEYLLERIHPADVERIKGIVAEMPAERKTVQGEYRIVLPGGDMRLMHTIGDV